VKTLIDKIDKILNLLFLQSCLGCGRGGVLLCDDCSNKFPPPIKLEGYIFAATSYQSKLVQQTIQTLKYKGAKSLAGPLAQLLAKRICSCWPDFINSKKACFIPVPLSRKRLKERGFNQAELIAKHLSDIVSVRIFLNVLYKHKETVSQVEIKNRKKRLNNLKGAFGIKNSELVKGKIVYLVDDVSTTGATIDEGRRVLLEAGAQKVIGLVVAK
jgi:ComF family protein